MSDIKELDIIGINAIAETIMPYISAETRGDHSPEEAEYWLKACILAAYELGKFKDIQSVFDILPQNRQNH